MKYSKLIVLIFTICFSYAIVDEMDLSIEAENLKSIIAFSFYAEGTYDFIITSTPTTPKPQLMLLISAEENECKQIGKSCSYKLLQINDICNTETAVSLSANSFNIYPVLIPSIGFKYNAAVYDYNSIDWKLYAPPTIDSTKYYINNILEPNIIDQLNLTYKDENLDNVKQVRTKITGTINSDIYAYFVIMNCYSKSIKLHVEYSLLNPDNEQLSSTDIPHKVQIT